MCPQVQDEEMQVSGGKDEDEAKEQEPWFGVVPVEMDDSKASTGNQESFADAMVNKVSRGHCRPGVILWSSLMSSFTSNNMNTQCMSV